MEYHQPVLVNESIEGLNIDPTGTYVDATFGGGGHSQQILSHLTTGKLIAFDQDPEATKNAISDERFLLVQQNFRFLKNNLKLQNGLPIKGLLVDLGISSFQIDTAERGFSTRFEGELDMRMDTNSALTAKQIINKYPEEELIRILREYGELHNAFRLGQLIVVARKRKEINSVNQFKEAIADCVDKKRGNQYLAKVFQALRIEVNRELEALKELLEQSTDVIKVGGRLVVISYHSLEDRLVKNFMKAGNLKGEQEKDFYGNVQRPFEPINRKVIRAPENEVNQNPRARSAKLRIAQRI